MIRRLLGQFAASALALLIVSTPVFATVYGEGPYSSCSAGKDCPVSPSPTVQPTPSAVPPIIIETPSGIDFSVNLNDGQVLIPPSYTVLVTPLNGQGKTAAKAEFLVDGVLVFTALPEPTGTFVWQWTLQPNTQSTVTVILYDGDNVATKRTVKLRIAALASPAASASPSVTPKPVAEAKNPIEQIQQIGTSIKEGVTRLVHQIPVPVAYAFPYLLFILIGAALLLLVWQARGEVAEAEALNVALARKKALDQDKATFMQLASHYLRTPLAVMGGGLDVLMAQHAVPVPQGEQTKAAIEALHTKIERLLTQAVGTEVPGSASDDDHTFMRKLLLWLKPGFLVPLILLAIFTFGFNALVAAVNHIETGVVNTLIQIALFVLLGLAFYGLIRSRILRRRRRERTQRLMIEQSEIEQARNTLLVSSTAEFEADMLAIKRQFTSLPAGQGTNIARDGYVRFERVLRKLALASRLRTPHGGDMAPAEAVSLTSLINGAVATVAEAAQAKHLRVDLPDDVPLQLAQPDWIKSVLASLLDNAVAYSPEGGLVSVTLEGGMQYTTIRVSDEGPGIANDKLPSLFRPFTRADGALVFDHEGMGFSLYLDKLIMDYLGGTIEAVAHEPQGLTVAIHIPA